MNQSLEIQKINLVLLCLYSWLTLHLSSLASQAPFPREICHPTTCLPRSLNLPLPRVIFVEAFKNTLSKASYRVACTSQAYRNHPIQTGQCKQRAWLREVMLLAPWDAKFIWHTNFIWNVVASICQFICLSEKYLHPLSILFTAHLIERRPVEDIADDSTELTRTPTCLNNSIPLVLTPLHPAEALSPAV